MWSYQESYRILIQILTRNVLKCLGAPEDSEVLLVGARAPDSSNHHPICVEPEDGKWSLSLFKGLLDTIESNYKDHDMHNMFFGDEASMRDKPEWIHRDSVRSAVEKSLKKYDFEHNIKSFCGDVRRIGDYYVTPIIQVPDTTFEKFPPLPFQPNIKKHGHRSLIHAAIHTTLKEATEELHNPDPGRIASNMRSAEEIVQIAAANFMRTPGLAIDNGYMFNDLFNSLNLISSLLYEGTKGIGKLILVDPDNDAVQFLVKLEEQVPFHKHRWVRKILQMASSGVGIIANSQCIYGLGQLSKSHNSSAQDAFTVVFIDHYHWELRCDEQALLRSHYGNPKLPQEPFDKMAFLANYTRLFPLSTKENGMNLWNLILIQIHQDFGSMIVIAEDAEKEARRLNKQGTRIKPTPLTSELLMSVSCIDGTTLLDPNGNCHAIGVILDGEVTEQCTPSRGSRYNSGVRYVQTSKANRLAVVVSDDRTVDVIPQIRKLVSRSKIENHITSFENATLDNYHNSRNWLDKHRFYINAEQCARINKSINRLDAQPRDPFIIHLATEKFEVDLEMDKSYLTS